MRPGGKFVVLTGKVFVYLGIGSGNMIPKKIEDITEADLLALIENSVAERKTLEYKSELPGKKDEDKREFLSDVSSFANASGGEILYGMEEQNSAPTKLIGVDGGNIDEDIRRLESLTRDGIRPRIPDVRFLAIPLAERGRVAVIGRVPNSWQSPHRVVLKGHDKFYGRDTKGKYPLDVDELRTAFNLSATVGDRMRKFRSDRVLKMMAGEGPAVLTSKACVIVHVLPLVSFTQMRIVDIVQYAEHSRPIRMLKGSGGDRRYNFDGVLEYRRSKAAECHGYVQLFRNGIIEAVYSLLYAEERGIPSWYENGVIRALKEYMEVLKHLALQPPLFVVLTLAGVKGLTMDSSAPGILVLPHEVVTIDRDPLIVPEVAIESDDVDVARLMKPAFDSVCNACGYKGSQNYDDDGNWKEGHWR